MVFFDSKIIVKIKKKISKKMTKIFKKKFKKLLKKVCSNPCLIFSESHKNNYHIHKIITFL